MSASTTVHLDQEDYIRMEADETSTAWLALGNSIAIFTDDNGKLREIKDVLTKYFDAKDSP